MAYQQWQTKKKVLNKRLGEANVLSEILIRVHTTVLLIRVIGLSEVQFHFKILLFTCSF